MSTLRRVQARVPPHQDGDRRSDIRIESSGSSDPLASHGHTKTDAWPITTREKAPCKSWWIAAKREVTTALPEHLPAETQMYVPRVEAVLLQREGMQLEELPAPKM